MDKAFPTAYGAGQNSRADVAYTHRIVTNLNDSGPGSFRDACQPNSIVSFNVSGIGLNSNNTYADLQNVIILGQTAPPGGFEYGGPGLRAEYAENVIIRYISFRNTWTGRDAVDFIGCQNIIVDHCSLSFGGDETMSFRASFVDTIVSNISVTNNHFNFGKTGMLLGDSGDVTKSSAMSCIGNLWSVISHRFPNLGGDTRFDIIGNTVFDFSLRLMVTIGSIQLNEINNSYIAPDPNGAKNQARIVEYNPSIYTEGNTHNTLGVVPGGYNWVLWRNRVFDSGEEVIDPLPLTYRALTSYPLMNFEVNDLQNASWWLDKSTVIKDIGNCYTLDNNGQRVVQIQDVDISSFDRITNNIAFPWTSANDYVFIPELVDWQNNVYPTQGGVIVNTHSPSTHTATVSNSWITSKGLSPGTFDPMGNDLDPLYTNIEVYSFEVDSFDTNTEYSLEDFQKISGRNAIADLIRKNS